MLYCCLHVVCDTWRISHDFVYIPITDFPLQQFLNGDIDQMIDAMIAKDQEEKLRQLTEESTVA